VSQILHNRNQENGSTPDDSLSVADKRRAYNQALLMVAQDLRDQRKRAPEIKAALKMKEIANERTAALLADQVPSPRTTIPARIFGMTLLNKALLTVCIVLALTVVYLGREQVTPAGPRNVMTMVRNPWTGRVYLCMPYGGECRQTYPPVDTTEPLGIR
jgi:hypothetical protein